MSKEPLTCNGNKALDNIALFKTIRDTEFKSRSGNKKAGTKSALKAVCFVLATYRNNVTAQCNPTIKTIAKGAGCSSDTARRAIDELAKIGFIIKMNMGARGSRENNHYYFVCDFHILVSMHTDGDHEISKVSEYDYVYEAIKFFTRYLN